MSDSVMDILVALGATGDDVANSLKLKGIKGKKGKTAECPIAAYLEMQSVVKPCVNVNAVRYGPYCGVNRASITTPLSVQQFINRFDLGHYPDLELPQDY